MQATESPFLRYVQEAKDRFPTEKKGLNALASEYRRAAPTGRRLLDTFIQKPRNHIYLGTRDMNMESYDMYDGPERHQKISLHFSGFIGGGWRPG